MASGGRSAASTDQTFAVNALTTSENRVSADGGDTLAIAAGVRRLTPRECERLSGWPDDHTRWTADGREIADLHRYRMTGNAVVSPVAEWLGRQLVAVDAHLRGESC